MTGRILCNSVLLQMAPGLKQAVQRDSQRIVPSAKQLILQAGPYPVVLSVQAPVGSSISRIIQTVQGELLRAENRYRVLKRSQIHPVSRRPAYAFRHFTAYRSALRVYLHRGIIPLFRPSASLHHDRHRVAAFRSRTGRFLFLAGVQYFRLIQPYPHTVTCPGPTGPGLNHNLASISP